MIPTSLTGTTWPLAYPVESHFLPNLIGRESLSTQFRSVQNAPFARIGPGVARLGRSDGYHLPLRQREEQPVAWEAARNARAAGGGGSRRRR